MQKSITTLLKKGDLVVVIAGGNEKKRANKGKTGKILRFLGERVVVEGINMIARHKKATPTAAAAKTVREGSIHISNVMYYADAVKKGVRLKVQVNEAGKKIRGYKDPTSKAFVSID